MANLAQTVNVLQALVLTEGERMVLTPTYHVFEMYRAHHDAVMLPTDLSSVSYEYAKEAIPAISASASRDDKGKVCISLCNLDHGRELGVSCELRGTRPSHIAGRVLTAEAINAHNTIDQPAVVKPAQFDGATLTDNDLLVDLPARSVVVLEIE
jgi:alpha-N-arabinofuranosidase